MERHEIEREISDHADELDRLSVLLEQGPLGPDLQSELTVLARAVLQVHDLQMPMMIALQRGDASLDDLRARAREEVVDRGHRYAARWLSKKIADGGFPNYDTDAVVAVALGSLLAYAAQKVTFNGPHSPSTRRGSSTPGSSLAESRQHRRTRPRHLRRRQIRIIPLWNPGVNPSMWSIHAGEAVAVADGEGFAVDEDTEQRERHLVFERDHHFVAATWSETAQA